jgi:hypothetical protein
MNRLLKTFLLWLLIAALPLQGVAAVVKASCGQRHHSAFMAAGHASGHAHEDGAAHHGHGDMHETMSAADDEPPNVGNDSPSDSAKQVHTACSACAACCVGAVAPPSSVALTSTFDKVSTALTPPASSFTGFIPPGLERPPKSLSA